MSFFGLLDHLLNLLLPALVVGTGVAILAPLLMKKARPNHSWLRQSSMNSVVCGLTLVLGLVLFGRDGKMLSYTAMVLACASSQWFAARAWRA